MNIKDLFDAYCQIGQDWESRPVAVHVGVCGLEWLKQACGTPGATFPALDHLSTLFGLPIHVRPELLPGEVRMIGWHDRVIKRWVRLVPAPVFVMIGVISGAGSGVQWVAWNRDTFPIERPKLYGGDPACAHVIEGGLWGFGCVNCRASA